MLMFSIRGYVNKVKTPANEVASKGQILLRLLEVTSECRCFLTDQKLCTGKAFYGSVLKSDIEKRKSFFMNGTMV